MFEALHNAFDAIEDLRKVDRVDGRIQITIKRGEGQVRMPGMGADLMTGAEIVDNGVGLDDDNWEAFTRLYTRRKAAIGGKGVGRLTWLKVFECAAVQSVYRRGDQLRRRTFEFSLPKGVSNLVDEAAGDDARPGTSVTLTGLKKAYREGVNVRTETLSRRVVEHFLTYFVLDGPGVSVTLADGEARNDLREVYRWMVLGDATVVDLDVKGEALTLRHFLVRGFPGGRHEVRWCARDRIVTEEPLTHEEIPGLGTRIDWQGQSSIYYCYVTSELLTRSANQARTRFLIHDAGTAEQPGMEDLRIAVRDEVRRFLDAHTSARREATTRRLEEFTAEAPQYRHVVRNYPERLTHLSPDIEDRKLEVELAKVRGEVDYETRDQARAILSRGVQPVPEKLAALTAAITATQRADLAGYVAHRRLVLDLVRATLRQREGDDKYPFEKDFHKLVFPMRVDTTELTGDPGEHNLWLLDERLAFYSFLASDKEFNKTQVVVEQEGDDRRPDLFALDRVAAFGFGDALELRGVTLVEFKRAEGLETDRDDPVQRLLEYTRLVRAGKLRKRDGQLVPISGAIPIYAFAICNVTSGYEQTLRDTYQASRMADGSWLIGRENHLLQIHVIPYIVLALNAEKRNAVFFDRAGLPTVHGQ